MEVLSKPSLLLRLGLLAGFWATICRAQININVGPLGGTHHRWYVWLIVSLAGVTLIYCSFFVIRGFLVARKRRRAFLAEGVSPDDTVYTEKHQAILSKLLPRSKMPQGKGSTNFSPMLSSMDTWEKQHAQQMPAVPEASNPKLSV